MTMTTQELISSLTDRGIDNPESVVEQYNGDIIERSVAFWDQKRRTTRVGPGLLVQTIRRGGPSPVEATAATSSSARPDWYGWVREHFADVLAVWPYGVHVLASRASALGGGGWDVTPDLVREWWEQTAWATHVRDLEREAA